MGSRSGYLQEKARRLRSWLPVACELLKATLTHSFGGPSTTKTPSPYSNEQLSNESLLATWQNRVVAISAPRRVRER
jgi:hypothetical protein